MVPNNQFLQKNTKPIKRRHNFKNYINMQIYCSRCKKHTDEACPKKLIMITNIKIKRVSRCSECLPVKSFVDRMKNKDQLKFFVS